MHAPTRLLTPDSVGPPVCSPWENGGKAGVTAEGRREPPAASLITLGGMSAPKHGQLLGLITSLSFILDPQFLSQENGKCLILCDKESLEDTPGRGDGICKGQGARKTLIPDQVIHMLDFQRL